MKFSLVDEIQHPRERVFATLRDRLPDCVPFMANVDSLTVESRIEEGDVVKLVNLWRGSSADVPGPLRPLLKPETLSWVDRATWDQGRWRCEWEITLPAVPDAITARGFNTYLDEGGETVIQLNGEFVVHPDRIRGVPSFVARSVAPTLEKFVIGLIQPNLKKTNQAVAQYLDQAG